MKKRLFFCIPFLLIMVFYYSCTKDKTAAPPDCSQLDSLNTYTNSVKPIMDNYCATVGCHDPLFASGGLVLDTYEHTANAARNDGKFFCAIEWSCTPNMPNTGIKLADSLIAKIQAWKSNCYAQ